jgi:hypothetical protein
VSGDRKDEPRGTPGILAGAPPRPRPRRDGAITEQLDSEIEQQHEESALDRDGEVRPERPVESGRTEHTADQTGIEIDHADEPPAD